MLQSRKKWSKCDRNNVRFLPVTATYIYNIIAGGTCNAYH